ncbi:MAG: hypothetical protein QNK37_20740 [Acidobacteriota bacterium]|nr:hypothetical protein [Acidobacteriota bacterium]
MLIFFLATLLSSDIPYQPFLSLTDEHAAGGHYLIFPADAVTDGTRLFVADEDGYRIFLVDQAGTRTFGSKGQGPDKFRNGPVALSLENGRLGVFEWNYHDVSFYTLDGRFLEKKKPDRLLHFGDLTVKAHHIALCIQSGHYFRFDEGCMFAELREPSVLGQHLARAYLARGESGPLILARANGLLAVVDSRCDEKVKMRLPIGAFAAEPEIKPRESVFIEGRLEKMYRNGVPLIGVAARSLQQVWVLVRNEHTEERLLYEVNLERRQIVSRYSLDAAFNKLRYMNGILLLISGEEGLVRSFRVADVDR